MNDVSGAPDPIMYLKIGWFQNSNCTVAARCHIHTELKLYTHFAGRINLA